MCICDSAVILRNTQRWNQTNKMFKKQRFVIEMKTSFDKMLKFLLRIYMNWKYYTSLKHAHLIYFIERKIWNIRKNHRYVSNYYQRQPIIM